MPRIFDNIEQTLLDGLRPTLEEAIRADICVGYFHLRGWRQLAGAVDQLPADAGGCRLLIGMQRLPADEVRENLRLRPDGVLPDQMDTATANRLRREAAQEFRQQLTFGAPSNHDEATLRRLVRQLRGGKLRVKLFTRHPLHAKLYLLHRRDLVTPIVGYLGSSNLTLAGLAGQGELNVDVVDRDAGCKLQHWFDDRWEDRFCIEITDELAAIVDDSWAREALVPPYHVYLKIAYHLAQEAREGLREFKIPSIFGNMLFDFQVAAVKIAAQHLNRRGGVLIGDVVGLGKTLMATALARIMQDDQGDSTLILCPKNLDRMWNWYREEYSLNAKVIPFSRMIAALPDLRRYQLVLIDESHNLRNREGKQYGAIRDYIERNGARCILLSATPYNKDYRDLGAQLRLFVAPDADLGIRPEAAIRALGGDAAFGRRRQVGLRTLAAFEQSGFADDWRDLMRLYLVRRTRSFIQANYAQMDDDGRNYLRKPDGTRDYFPVRVPRNVEFATRAGDRPTSYARLVEDDVVQRIEDLSLPRYGLAAYVRTPAGRQTTPKERQIIENLSRAGMRLKGFCRTILFKRLESSGWSFLLSVERHALRNYVFLHALDNGLAVPIGTQDVAALPLEAASDTDMEARLPLAADALEPAALDAATMNSFFDSTEDAFQQRAARVYDLYASREKDRFQWLPADLFSRQLADDLRADARRLLDILRIGGRWQPAADPKLTALIDLLGQNGRHPADKVLIFTQFADTASYLAEHLQGRVPGTVEAVTGAASDPTSLARRFSPKSNDVHRPLPDEIRVLISTDVLSEGQNLQDSHIVVNYDLPWAIIRLVQRVGRVDRIGQHAPEILCYSFLPADGIEAVIRLRQRVRQRLHDNAEVVGSDERFFEDDSDAGDRMIVDLFHEQAGVLDDEEDESEVDLASYAFQIWQNATADNPGLRKAVEALPDVIYATRKHRSTHADPAGVLLYLRTAHGADALVRVDRQGESVSYSPLAILRTAECAPETPALPRQPNHHYLVQAAARAALAEGVGVGGGLGRTTGARYRAYNRLKAYAGTFNVLTPNDLRADLPAALQEMLRYPLTERARTAINRQIRAGITDEGLARLVLELRAERTLSAAESEGDGEPQIICSLGLADPA